jgi:hypothetical protein
VLHQKAKGKNSKATTTTGDSFEADLKALVEENLLQPKEIIQW